VENQNAETIPKMLASHFRRVSIQQITVSERVFPFRVRADLQKSLDEILGDGFRIEHFCGVRKEVSHSGFSLTDCFKEQIYGSAESVRLSMRRWISAMRHPFAY
jgi:cell division protease FtsH